MDFQLRNQQAVGSSPTGGSNSFCFNDFLMAGSLPESQKWNQQIKRDKLRARNSAQGACGLDGIEPGSGLSAFRGGVAIAPCHY